MNKWIITYIDGINGGEYTTYALGDDEDEARDNFSSAHPGDIFVSAKVVPE